MDPAADDVAILHRHEIDGIVPGTGDVAAFDVDVLALVDLERLLRNGIGGNVAQAPNRRAADEDVEATVEMQHVTAAGRDVEADEIEVAAVVDVHARQPRRAVAVDGPEHDGSRPRAVTAFPVVGHHRFGIDAGREVDLEARRQLDVHGYPPPGFGKRAQGHGP
jgi:hypothetical protein